MSRERLTGNRPMGHNIRRDDRPYADGWTDSDRLFDTREKAEREIDRLRKIAPNVWWRVRKLWYGGGAYNYLLQYMDRR